MRLYPPVWILTRRVTMPSDLGGRTVAPGTVIHICPHTLHRHPQHWPDPDRFLPERFAESDSRHRFAYPSEARVSAPSFTVPVGRLELRLRD